MLNKLKTKIKGRLTKTTSGTPITDDMAVLAAQIQDKGWAVFFDYIEDETSTIEASITDNFVETNHSVQDHIAIKPRIYRLRGCVGEVIFEGGSKWLEALGNKIDSNPILKKTKEALTPIAVISPIVSNYTQAAINVVKQVESSYNRYRQMLENTLLPDPNKPELGAKQESTVAMLNRMLEQRTPVMLKGLMFQRTLTKDDGYERKYYIQSVTAHQGNNAFISDIEVTIKEFRIATTKITSFDKNQVGGFNIQSVAATTEQNTGGATGTEVDVQISDIPVVKQIQQTAKEAAEGKTTWGNIVQGVCNTVMESIPAFIQRNKVVTNFISGGRIWK